MIGEFIGLVMMKPSGIKMFLNHFDKVNSTIAHESPFQRASEWQKSYLTDIFQDMIEVGLSINCSKVEGKWKEFDTIQDFERGLPF